MTHPAAQCWQNDLAYLLYDVARLLRRRIDVRLADLGLSDAQWRVMGLLHRSEGLTQTELALLLGIQKAPLGEHLDKLEAMGYLQRRRDPGDRRVNRLYPSVPAREQAQIIALRFHSLSLELQSTISEQQWQGLQRTLANLVKGFATDQTRVVLSRISFEHNLHYIGVLSRQLRKQFDGALKALGFTRSQWLVLLTVILNEGISQTDLASSLDIPKAPLGQVLDKLEQKQWLQRQQDAADGRVKRLIVADRARPAIAALTDDYQRLHRVMDEVLGAKDMLILKTGLSQLRQSLLSLSLLERSKVERLA